MSAIRSNLMQAPGDLDWSQWVDARDAATKLGVNIGHLRRRCASELAPKAQAIMTAPPATVPGGGGQARWFIHRGVDARLTNDSERRSTTADLAAYPKDKVDDALARAACVKTFRHVKATRGGQLKDWLDALIVELAAKHPSLNISRAALYRWDVQLKEPGDITPLIDRRGGDQRSVGHPSCWKMFTTLYLDQRQPSLAECWRQVKIHAKANDLPWCSKRTCERQLDAKIPPETQMFNRDPKAWRHKYAPYIEQDAERFPAGRCWVGDHTQLDFWTRYGKELVRPWLTTWQDWRTRKIVGWQLSPSPNSDTIMAALKRGLVDSSNMGGPSTVWIDNGKDYDCWFLHGQTKKERQQRAYSKGEFVDESQFEGLFSLLQIDAHFSVPYGPNGKARQERWYGTLHTQFDKRFATYCGSSTATKPEILESILKRAINIPSFDHARQRLDEFIAAFNDNGDHQMSDLVDDNGTTLSPAQAMTAMCDTRRVMADPDVIDYVCQHWHPPVTVGRNGVTIRPYGIALTYGYADPNLTPYKAPVGRGRKKPRVLVSFDPDDLRQVRVHTTSGKLICIAAENELGGKDGAIGRQTVSDLTKRKRQYAKSLKNVGENRHFEYLSAAELLHEQSQPDPTPDPTPGVAGSIQMIQTPMDGQGDALQRERMRQAAGGELDASDQGDQKPLDPSVFDARKDDDDDFDGQLLASIDELRERYGDDQDDDEENDDTMELIASSHLRNRRELDDDDDEMIELSATFADEDETEEDDTDDWSLNDAILSHDDDEPHLLDEL